MQHVLLATNGDRAAVAATRWLARRARSHALDVDIVRVVDDERPAVPPAPPTLDAAVREARDYLAWAAPSAETRPRTVAGDPRRTLLELAQHADMLVLGTRRTAAGSPHLTAAFATRVAEAAPCATVVVPGGWAPSDGPVVVGVEGDGSDDAAVAFAAREASVLHRDLVLVHAWRLAAAAVPALQNDLEGNTVDHDAGARLDAVASRARHSHPDVQLIRVLEPGDAARALFRAGSGASLLVVGRHGLGAVDRLLLRSVSRDALERPTCPVAVVPPVPPV